MTIEQLEGQSDCHYIGQARNLCPSGSWIRAKCLRFLFPSFYGWDELRKKKDFRYVDLFKTLGLRVSTGKTHTSCDYVLNLPWKPIITQTMTNYPKLEDPDSVLVKEIQACLIFFYLRVPNLPAEGWTKLSEYSVWFVHTCILVRTWAVCILSMLALTVFCVGSVFCLTSAMLIYSMLALCSTKARRVLFLSFRTKYVYLCAKDSLHCSNHFL